MPSSPIIPELPYPDVRTAVYWLCHSFGFKERLQIGNHRAQLTFGEGAIVVIQGDNPPNTTCSLMVRVANVDSHFEHARESGAQIVSPPTDYPYGERQYTVEDLGGHRWTFSQTIANIDPQTWGGELFE